MVCVFGQINFLAIFKVLFGLSTLVVMLIPTVLGTALTGLLLLNFCTLGELVFDTIVVLAIGHLSCGHASLENAPLIKLPPLVICLMISRDLDWLDDYGLPPNLLYRLQFGHLRLCLDGDGGLIVGSILTIGYSTGDSSSG